MWDRNRSWVLIPYTIGPGLRPPNEAMNSINALQRTPHLCFQVARHVAAFAELGSFGGEFLKRGCLNGSSLV